jgi:ankyrin repeat protein
MYLLSAPAAFLLIPAMFAAEPVGAIYNAIRDNDLITVRALPASELQAKNRRGTTPLMYAAAFGSAEAVKLLLDKGANVNARNSFNATALLWCAGDPVKARMLVEHNADVNAQSTQGRTPLMIAARRDGNSSIVSLLLAKGADPTATDKLGVTALHQAANAGDPSTIRLLLDKGADVNAMDVKGDTPLMGAAGFGSVAAVRLLLEKGARVNVARTKYAVVRHGQVALVGLTPLIHAAPYGSPELITLLIQAGADVNARDSRGMTPLMFAVASETQSTEVVRILLKAGADIKAKDQNGETALTWASKFGNSKILSALYQAGAEPGTQGSARPRTSLLNLPTPAAAISRSVDLLQRSSAQFFRESGCVGCHHQPATSMALSAARRAGIKVNEAAAREMGEALRLGWGVSEDDMLQGIHRGGGSDRIVNQLLAISAAGYNSDATIDAAVVDFATLQHRDGRWFDEYEARSPIADGMIARVAYAVRALQVLGWPGRKRDFDATVDRAREFLNQATAITGDDRALLLLGRFWSGSSGQKLEDAARQLIASQRRDGGWAGNDNLGSDVYSSANSLIALYESGAVSTQDEVYRRGVQYLLKRQFEDGSWYVPSRAIKFQPYFQSGFPFDHDQWISASATALAVRALAPVLGQNSKSLTAPK